MDKDNSKNVIPASLEELFSLSAVSGKPVKFSFTATDLSSQGGLLFLREYERHRNFIRSLCSHIEDTRTSYLVKHTYYEMITQRIFQIAAGYEDAGDCDLLRKDKSEHACKSRTLHRRHKGAMVVLGE